MSNENTTEVITVSQDNGLLVIEAGANDGETLSSPQSDIVIRDLAGCFETVVTVSDQDETVDVTPKQEANTDAGDTVPNQADTPGNHSYNVGRHPAHAQSVHGRIL